MQLLARICLFIFLGYVPCVLAADEPIEGAPSLSAEATENSNVEIVEESPSENLLSDTGTTDTAEPVKPIEEPAVVEAVPEKEPVVEEKPTEVAPIEQKQEEPPKLEKPVVVEATKEEGQETPKTIEESTPKAEVTEKVQEKPKEETPKAEKEPVKPTTEEANTETETPVIDALRRKQKNAANSLYSPEYLKNMYVPYFYSVYELPQKLSPYLLLRSVKAAKNSSSLIYEIGVADSIGPLDLDGTPEDNKVIKLFCQITLNDAVLHRLEDVELEFYHGERDFFSKKLTFLNCTGNESYLVEKKLLSKEKIRLDNEFVFAYDEQKDPMLSEEYLQTKFIPYALDRIDEKFLPIEKNARMFLEDKSSVIISFTIENSQDVKNAAYTTNRIARTCEIPTYSKYLLPRIAGIKYRYLAKDDSLIREIVISSDTCDAINSKRTIE